MSGGAGAEGRSLVRGSAQRTGVWKCGGGHGNLPGIGDEQGKEIRSTVALHGYMDQTRRNLAVRGESQHATPREII